MKMLKKSLSLLLVVAMSLSMMYIAPTVKAVSASDYASSISNSYARIETTQNVDLHQYPTDASESPIITTVPAGTVLTATKLMYNIYGFNWYEVQYYGQTLYCRAAYTNPVDHLLGDVTISGVQAPASLKKGASFSIKGTISTTYNQLTNVTVSIYSGTSIQGLPYMTVSANPSSNSYNLLNSTIDNNLKFSSLPAGVYTYVISAGVKSCGYGSSGYIDFNKTVILETQTLIVTDYSNPNTLLGTGVNVSSADGSITWSKAASGIDYAVLEIGQGTTLDSKFHTNVKGCINNNIPYGVMLYAKATSAEEATAEAEFVIGKLMDNDYRPDMPIWYCVEDEIFLNMDDSTRLTVIQTFCDAIAAAGYQPGIFTYINMWRNKLTAEYYCSVAKWVAQIDGFTSAGTTTYDAGIWQHQYSWKGEISGFPNQVDVNYCYYPYSGNSGDTSYAASCTYFPSHAKGQTNASTTMREYPRSDYNSVTSLSYGASVDVIGVYRNPLGEYWYRVVSGSNVGYVPASSITISEFLFNDLTLVNSTMDSNLTKGRNYDLSGIVTSQYNNIGTLQARVYAGEDPHSGSLLSASVSPNTKEYNLALNTNDFSLQFKTLERDYYTYELSAIVHNYYIKDGTLASETQTVVLCADPFTVGGYTVELPDTGICNHTMVTSAAVAATCTKSGLTAGSYCSKCGYVEAIQSTIPPLGHDWSGGTCKRCQVICGHDFADGYCTVCGSAAPIQDYYLFGYINGSNYACEEDAENIGIYKFVDGTLTVTFTSNSYVGVKSADNNFWFMTNGWLGENVTSAILYDYSELEDPNKLFVPGGRQIIFTLTPNSDGTVTLSYEFGICNHNWQNGVCSTCGTVCSHSYSGGACVECGMACSHSFTNSTCNKCGYVCKHSWTNGKCTICNAYCSHSYTNGKCSKCGYSCRHNWNNGSCTICKLNCGHSFTDGTCTVCGIVCTHVYSGGKCVICGSVEEIKDYYLFGYINGNNYACEEDAENIGTYKFTDGVLTTIFTEASYVGVKSGDNQVWYMTNGWMGEEATSAILHNADDLGEEANKLHVPGNRSVTFTLVANGDGTLTLSYTLAECSHLYNEGVCTICGTRCSHKWTNGVCSVCDLTCAHSYTGGICTTCGSKAPVVDYYLFGYINGANYACEEDADNLGIYKFVDGTLTATFTEESYVAVRTDNDNWYMTYGWQGNTVTSVKLYNTSITGENSNKLYVPANRAVTFKLVVNSDDTLSLSYTMAECTHSWTNGTCAVCGATCSHNWSNGACSLCGKTVSNPTLTLKNYTVSFEGEVRYNIYFTVSNLGDVKPEDMGLLTWKDPVTSGTYANATDIIPGSMTDGSQFVVYSRGVAAKNLSDNLYFKIYAKLEDGSYIYTDLKSVNAKTYANSILNKSTNADMKALVVAMLNYGAAAQTYFGHKAYNLMNASLTDAQKALVMAYDSSMVAPSVSVSTTKAGSFTKKGFGTCTITASFEAAFVLNYYLSTTYVPDGDVILYYWTLDDFNKATVLTKANASGSMVTLPTGVTNQYWGEVTGIAAKELDQTVFVAAVYTSGGVEYTTSIMNYSMGRYCVKLGENDSSAQQELAQATAVYGYYAKQYFANLAANS